MSTFYVYKIYITSYNDYMIIKTHQQRGEDMLRVLGLGDNVVDKYMHIRTMYPGGNALNFAVYAKMFGIEAGYLGVFGDDEAAPMCMIRSVVLGWISPTAVLSGRERIRQGAFGRRGPGIYRLQQRRGIKGTSSGADWNGQGLYSRL